MRPVVVKAEQISRIFDAEEEAVTALRNVNFMVTEGEFVCISGPSGSGKTTLLSILGCLDRPSSGLLELFGKRVDHMGDRELSKLRLREVGLIFQEHNLLPSLTVKENIELPLALANNPTNQSSRRATELLREVSMEHLSNRLPSEISRGQRQRVAALRALANQPRIILGDEPTSDLDRENASILLDFLKKINEETNTTILIATTDPSVMKDYAQRFLGLNDGALTEIHDRSDDRSP